MSQQVDTAFKTFQAGAAIAQYLRVKLSAGKLAASGVDDDDLGQIEDASFADLDYRRVRLRNAMGTAKFVAAGAITAGAKVYQAASGKISATASGRLIGLALEAASGNNSIIEVLPMRSGYRTVAGQLTTVTATDTVVTGLTTVVSVVATLDDNPIDDPEWVSATIGDQAGTPAAGSVIIKTWKNTGGTDPTPAAATTFSKKVNWVAVGY